MYWHWILRIKPDILYWGYFSYGRIFCNYLRWTWKLVLGYSWDICIRIWTHTSGIQDCGNIMWAATIQIASKFLNGILAILVLPSLISVFVQCIDDWINWFSLPEMSATLERCYTRYTGLKKTDNKNANCLQKVIHDRIVDFEQ